MKIPNILILTLTWPLLAFGQAHRDGASGLPSPTSDGHPESEMTMPTSMAEAHDSISENTGAGRGLQPSITPEEADYYSYQMTSMGVGPFGLLLIDQLEYRVHEGADLLVWDSEGWYGKDFNRFWFRSEGEQSLQGASSGAAEIHGYYSRLVAPFWDAQIGLRFDQEWEPYSDPSRVFGGIGLQGMAPYRFEVTPALFISDQGDFSSRLTATREYRFTQRLVGQGRFETEISAQEVPKFGVGEGFNYVELGLRLRYEIRREFAQYVGINCESKLSRTRAIARRSGADPSVLSFVAGVRFWFYPSNV